ncbi:MAG: type II toxin-antitoxin system RelE/ParE family toxin [Stellaceae bacterium]
MSSSGNSRDSPGKLTKGWRHSTLLPPLPISRRSRATAVEALKGDRNVQYSIRINVQWRICFEWLPHGAGPLNVEIVDYH